MAQAVVAQLGAARTERDVLCVFDALAASDALVVTQELADALTGAMAMHASTARRGCELIAHLGTLSPSSECLGVLVAAIATALLSHRGSSDVVDAASAAMHTLLQLDDNNALEALEQTLACERTANAACFLVTALAFKNTTCRDPSGRIGSAVMAAMDRAPMSRERWLDGCMALGNLMHRAQPSTAYLERYLTTALAMLNKAHNGLTASNALYMLRQAACSWAAYRSRVHAWAWHAVLKSLTVRYHDPDREVEYACAFLLFAVQTQPVCLEWLHASSGVRVLVKVLQRTASSSPPPCVPLICRLLVEVASGSAGGPEALVEAGALFTLGHTLDMFRACPEVMEQVRHLLLLVIDSDGSIRPSPQLRAGWHRACVCLATRTAVADPKTAPGCSSTLHAVLADAHQRLCAPSLDAAKPLQVVSELGVLIGWFLA